ncbi:DNA-binding protein RFX2 isoform X1 [Contarinia nasturtii]|uniref:DNA-binding protein RFX2 isoform X1 n=1 Tax=Contarinia nasturtii TaxID=265458 RepID=UPI0012D3B752|nr:DNA-binding protein RFX2 isoform X1 [Contarinia nasturtii]XP_031634494.1 DNA-binding protein RFX2 isoform X1 [Contarinia nasturtii]XP_031634495.1 DNA-binding protein RFX2 isoform X1 [Contarinia nasturtii]XP_031634496.1 DNA-binding protein RFX2 isoform X1 [Contarinia nasturtii]XP_031634498.1 DNA-binding protein RFX2 isoform X1 [Contarinia nasturtii]XP_031634499.1 DNA-binding protein RFX2 isoform X1 [Contarinia nasturtii]
MATQLALQRNFVTITPSSQISSKTTQSNHSTTTIATSATNGEIVTITDNQVSETTNTPIHIMQTHTQKKYILQAGTTSDGVSIIDVVPIDQMDSPDEAPITVSTILPTNSIASSPNNSNSQQITAQVAFVQTQDAAEIAESKPQFITVNVSQQENVTGHGTYVEYVDSGLYATSTQSQTQMAYPVYVNEYTSSTQQQYYAANESFSGTGTHQNETYIVPVEESLISNQSRESPQAISADVAYVHNQQTSTTPTTSESDCAPNIAHATRVSPATVSWLMDNYETAEGVSLPRSTLYNHYMRHCNEHKLDAVNAASFGKLIRSVFTGLRTRRLGTRGNSKYHYYGIRVKPGSNLETTNDDKTQAPNNSQAHQHTITPQSASNTVVKSRKSASRAESYEACSQFLGDGNRAIPLFPTIDFENDMPEDITLEDVDTLRSIYREHCEAFLDAILNLEFSTIESLWREFWRAQDNNNVDECEEEKYLSKYKLYNLLQCKAVQEFIKEIDYGFYQNMVDVLIPDVLRPIPSALTQAIRNFSKNLETWMTSAMTGCPQKIVQIKLSAVSAFSQTLRRYTSLNHLAQAARAVLQNSTQITQMLSDLNRVDFHNVQEQAAWVCECDASTVQRLENEFKAALQQQNSLEQWASWLRLVVDSALKEFEGRPTFSKAARQFLLKWSFYSSMVIRDLTLRSAASFGSFHLIRLLYDEYMFFIVEHKVAEANRTTPIEVMGKTDRTRNTTPDNNIDSLLETTYGDDEIKNENNPKRMRQVVPNW